MFWTWKCKQLQHKWNYFRWWLGCIIIITSKTQGILDSMLPFSVSEIARIPRAYLPIYHKNQPDVGKYTSPMDGMGYIDRLKNTAPPTSPTARCSRATLRGAARRSAGATAAAGGDARGADPGGNRDLDSKPFEKTGWGRWNGLDPILGPRRGSNSKIFGFCSPRKFDDHIFFEWVEITNYKYSLNECVLFWLNSKWFMPTQKKPSNLYFGKSERLFRVRTQEWSQHFLGGDFQ